MTKEELEKATGQELIDERNYCGVDGYYGVYLDNVNAEMLKRFNRLAELEEKLKHAEENCINKTCVVLKDKEDCVAKLLELEKENAELKEKAGCIIEDLKALYFSPVVTKDDLKRQDKIFAEAE